MKPLYEKIEIHSEADLPKEDGFYIASCKDYTVLEYHYCSEVKRDWLRAIDWYLLPIAQNTPEKSVEEIIKQLSGEPINDAATYTSTDYSSQSHQTVSDETTTRNELMNQLISRIPIDRANLAYIIQHEEISGTLLAGIRHAMQNFASQSSPNLIDKQIIAKQAELIEHFKSRIDEDQNIDNSIWWRIKERLESELKALQNSKGDKEELCTNCDKVHDYTAAECYKLIGKAT